MKIEKTSFGAVLDRIRPENGSVYFGHGIQEGIQPLFLASLIGQKKALVFAGESRTGSILQET